MRTAPKVKLRPESAAAAPEAEAGAERGPKEETTEAEAEAEEESAGREAAAEEGAEAPVEEAPRKPEDDPGFQAVLGRVRAVAQRQGHNNPAQQKAADAQAAAPAPSNDVEGQAAGAQVEKMAAQEPAPFDRAGFKAALTAKINAIAPGTLEEIDQFKSSGKAATVKGAVSSQVSAGKDAAQGPIKDTAGEAPDAGAASPKEVTPLPPTDPGPAPPDVGATAAAPKPKTEAEVSLAEESQALDEQMASARVTDEQLEKSNEPDFTGALDQKREAQQSAEEMPARYRAEEEPLLAGAQGQAAGLAGSETAAMHGTRAGKFGDVTAGQEGAKSKDTIEREKFRAKVQAIYDRTKGQVEARLDKVDTDAHAEFDAGATAAFTSFVNFVEQRKEQWKNERYAGVEGKATWVRDLFLPLPDEVSRFYKEGRDRYIKEMDGVVDKVADIVVGGLNESVGLISTGREEIQTAIKTELPASLRSMGQEVAGEFQQDFDDLRGKVDAKHDVLVDSLQKKYVDKLNEVDKLIEKWKSEDRGFLGQAADAMGGVLATIEEMRALLSRFGEVVEQILKDPIGFVGNLVAGIGAGLSAFMGNIGTHLQKGLMGWLFGNLAAAGIQMPSSFDLKGILTLAMGVLGLTYASIRAQAVKIFGEEVVARLEQAAEIFRILMTEGPAGLWQHIQGMVGDLKSMVLDGIKGFIIEKVIIAGITWVLSMLNPASAFVKACKAIVDIVMFFIQRASQIAALVNAVVNTLSAIAGGAVGAMASAVEGALASAVPVVISFLASLLGLGGIADKIKGIIAKVQEPIKKAITSVLRSAYNLLKKAGKFLFGKGKKKDDKKKDDKKDEDDPEKAAKIDAGLADLEAAEAAVLEDDGISEENAAKVAARTKSKHPVFKSLNVVDGGESWDYDYSASATRRESGRRMRRMTRVDIQFNRAAKYDAGEYAAQLAGQQSGINAMVMKKWLANRDAYLSRKEETGSGRAEEGGKAQEAFREKMRLKLIKEKMKEGMKLAEAEDWVDDFMSTQAALHDPDQIAGGDPTKIKKLGSKYINSSIGAQWRAGARIGKLDGAVREYSAAERKKLKMNVKLSSN